MALYERVKRLRTEFLRMTRVQFGAAIGISPERVQNLERDILSKPELNEPIYRLICHEFNVRMEWLKEGEEPIFQPTQDDLVHQAAQEMNLNHDEELVLKTYLSLDEEQREAARNFMAVLKTIFAAPAPPPQSDLTEDEAAELARERFRAQRRGRDASSTFEKTPGTAGSAEFREEIG